MIWEIYAYWNIEELRGIFEAVAMLTNADDYISLISTMMLVGLVAAVLGVLSGAKQLPDAFKWFVMGILLYFVMLVPKTDVALIDRTGTAPATTVSNVPLSLALLGHLTSNFGDWMTVGYETVMQVISPAYTEDGIQFTGNGFQFGEKVLFAAETAQAENISFRMNMTNFFEKCVFPEFDTGNISVESVLNAQDVWAAVSNVNPSLYVQLYNEDGTPVPNPTACDVAYDTVLPTQINNASDQVLTRMAQRLYPDKSSAVAKSALDSALSGSYSFYLNVSAAGSDIIKQKVLTNTFYDSTEDPTTATAVSMTEAGAEKNYSVLFNVAQNTIPKLRNVVEVIIYAVFPLVLVMIIVGGTKGGMALKSYIIALFWIQLWAPLYAVMNYMMSIYEAREFKAMITAGSELSPAFTSAIKTQVLSNSDIAGMMAMAIPMIALALAKGGEMAMTSFVSSATRPIESNAGMSSREVAKGDISMGNTSMDSASFANKSAFQHNMQPNINNGPVTRMDGIGNRYTTNNQGLTAHDSTAMENKGAFHNFSQAISERNSYAQGYDQSIKAAQKNMSMAGFEQGSSFANAGLISNAASGGKDWNNAFGNTYNSGTQQAFQTMDETARKLEAQEKVGQGQGAELVANLAAMVKAGVSLEAGALAEFRAGVGKKYSSQAIAEAAEAINGIDKDSVSGAATIMSQTSENEQIQDKLGLSNEAKTTLQAGNQRAEAYKEENRVELERAKGYQEKLDASEDRVSQTLAQLGAATPYSSMNDAAKNFVTGDGQAILGQIVEARNSGDFNTAANLQEQFDAKLGQFNSQFGAPTASNAQPLPQNAQQTVLAQHDQNVDGVLRTRDQNKELVHSDRFLQAVEDKKAAGAGALAGEEAWVRDSHDFHTDATNKEATMVQGDANAGRTELGGNKQVQGLDNIGLNSNGVLESHNAETSQVVQAGAHDIKNMANNIPGAQAAGQELLDRIESLGDKKDANPNHQAPGTGVQGTDAYVEGPNPKKQ